MEDDKKAPLDGRGPGVDPIPEPDSSLIGEIGAIGKLEEIVGAMMGNETEVTAPGIVTDNPDKTKNS